jgi:hypothetical protein
MRHKQFPRFVPLDSVVSYSRLKTEDTEPTKPSPRRVPPQRSLHVENKSLLTEAPTRRPLKLNHPYLKVEKAPLPFQEYMASMKYQHQRSHFVAHQIADELKTLGTYLKEEAKPRTTRQEHKRIMKTEGENEEIT